MTQTFAQYIVNKALPSDIQVTKPLDNKELKDILTKVYKKYPERYDEVVTKIKRIGDTFATFEGITMGIKEIEVPNKAARDKIISKAKKELSKSRSEAESLSILDRTQSAVIANDTLNGKDSATMLVKDSGAIGGKKIQLVKLRSTPVVVSGAGGKPLTELFDKSYSEGQTPFHQWLQSVDARDKLAEGQTQTSSPGELSKILHNTLAGSVISMDDCHTKHGIRLDAEDDIIGRYFAPPIPSKYTDNTEITPQIQKELLSKGTKKVVVRSPQTCAAPSGTVCSKCMGHSISTGIKHVIGTNVGYISAGNMAEPLTQMTLSAKHSSTMAKTDDSLRGDKGFRQFVEMPKEYTGQKLYCEVNGTIYNITLAPQGGKYVLINLTKPAQDKFIVYGKQDPKTKQFTYFIPPSRKLLDNIKKGVEVYPGMPLTDGINNLKDIARLQGLGITRTKAAEGMRNIYKNTGAGVDRRHFELLSRAGHNYLSILKAPKSFPYKRGEVVAYPEFLKAVYLLPKQEMKVEDSDGWTLVDQIHDVTAGTSITRPVIEHLKNLGIDRINVSKDIETTPSVSALTRSVDKSEDWLAIMNHRRLKENIITAASTGKKSDLHGYNPIPAYAYGTELTQDKDGRY